MQTVLAFTLLLAALGSAAYVATLHAVPTKVSLSVATVSPAFLLAYLILINAPEHLQTAFLAVGASVMLASGVALHYVYTNPLTAAQRLVLFKRTVIFVVAILLVAAFGTGMGWRIQKPQAEADPKPAKSISQHVLDSLNQLHP